MFQKFTTPSPLQPLKNRPDRSWTRRDLFSQKVDTNLPLQFQERSQYFFGVHHEMLSVAMCVHNPDRSPFNIESRDRAQAKSYFAEIVRDDFPVLH
jgi:hypothetical protein